MRGLQSYFVAFLLGGVVLCGAATKILAAPVGITAGETDKAASVFIAGLGNQAVQILSNKAITATARDQAFLNLMHTSFDLPTIGRFVIGRNVWQAATPAEQQEYLRLFEKLVIQIYSDRFSSYSGETFIIKDQHQEGERDIVVASHIVRPNTTQPISVDWRVRNFNGRMGIVDVVVEGISMSVTQRQEYGSVLARNDNQIAQLLAVMKTQLEKNGVRQANEAKTP
jgi:phospholipid transport system substrate-binding protein